MVLNMFHCYAVLFFLKANNYFWCCIIALVLHLWFSECVILLDNKCLFMYSSLFRLCPAGPYGPRPVHLSFTFPVVTFTWLVGLFQNYWTPHSSSLHFIWKADCQAHRIFTRFSQDSHTIFSLLFSGKKQPLSWVLSRSFTPGRQFYPNTSICSIDWNGLYSLTAIKGNGL